MILVALAVGQDAAGIVRGFVKSSGSGARLADVEITLTYQRPANQNAISRKTTTDANGRFEFRDVPVGAHHLTAEREGFFGIGTTRQVRGDVSVTANQPVQEVALEMVQGGVIRGHVFDSDGKPISGIYVRPLRAA